MAAGVTEAVVAAAGAATKARTAASTIGPMPAALPSFRPSLLCLGLLLTQAAASAPAAPADAFWTALRQHCGKAYAGRLVDPQAQDQAIAAEPLVMHVRDCSEAEIRIPFQVGSNRSRTWVLTRTPQGLRLKHQHLHEDGSEDRISQYGGDTRGPGSATEQAFPADAFTASLLPASASNVWTLGLDAARFEYRLTREGRRFQAVFDLSTPQPLPPPAWGSSR